MGSRVLVTGADTFWGGRVIQALEADPRVDVVLGLGEHDPSVPFERAEFVRTDQTYSILHRLVRATQVDTIVHTFLVSDSTTVRSRTLHDVNVIGTMNLLAAAGANDSSVRTVVVKSSTKIYGADMRDPATFTEDMHRSRPARSTLERTIIEAESLIADFAEDNPDVTVATIRFANVLGGGSYADVGSGLSFELPNQEDQAAHAPRQGIWQSGDAVIDPTGQHPSANELRGQQGVELIGGNDRSERTFSQAFQRFVDDSELRAQLALRASGIHLTKALLPEAPARR